MDRFVLSRLGDWHRRRLYCVERRSAYFGHEALNRRDAGMAADLSVINTWMAELDEALGHGSTRTRRDTAHAVNSKSLSLRNELGSETNIEVLNQLEAAINKSRQLHDAFHADLQHELEW